MKKIYSAPMCEEVNLVVESILAAESGGQIDEGLAKGGMFSDSEEENISDWEPFADWDM